MSSDLSPDNLVVQGVVAQGHGVASGRAKNSPYPHGSLAMQMPFFKSLGLDLSGYWLGTLNVSIAPYTWALLHADHCFERLAWTHLHPPETFSFVQLEMVWRNQHVQAWLYYPHPETKTTHHQNASVMEVIAPKLEGLVYGDNVVLLCRPGLLQLG